MFHNLHLPAQRCFDPLDEAALLVCTIRPNETQTEQVARMRFQQGFITVMIPDVGLVHQHSECAGYSSENETFHAGLCSPYMTILGYPFHNQEIHSHEGNLNDTYLECRLQRKTLGEQALAHASQFD